MISMYLCGKKRIWKFYRTLIINILNKEGAISIRRRTFVAALWDKQVKLGLFSFEYQSNKKGNQKEQKSLFIFHF